VILVAVGHRAPFNRLVRAVDAWAAANPTAKVFGQIANGSYRPRNFRAVDHFASSADRDEKLDRAELLVTHTGIDLLLETMERRLRILVLPRLSIFGEDRGNVQLALAERLAAYDLVDVARDEDDLKTLITAPRPHPPLSPAPLSEARRLQTTLAQVMQDRR
jgi:UDP-N-acetylglucosamine transferase subunit ALG13